MSFAARHLRGSRSESGELLRKLVLAFGFVSLAIGTLLAWNAPASGYEVSIYYGSPIGFWIGALFAFVAGGIVCVLCSRDYLAGVGVLLGWLTTVAIGGLPVVRSYRFHGSGDPMTHLGWAEDLRVGFIEFNDLFYPGGHSAVVFLGDVFQVDSMRAMLVFVAILVAVYALFVPLIVRAITNDPSATVIAAFSGFMLLPFNNVSTRLMFHTYSVGVLFLPVLLYFLVKHLTGDRAGLSVVDRVGGSNGALALTSIALLFFHPQVALNVVILLGTIVAVHLFYRRVNGTHPMAGIRPVYGVFVLVTVAWFVWISGHWQVYVTGESVMESAYGTLLGTEIFGQAVAETGDSAGSIGVSLGELFVKLFLVPAVFSLLSLWVVVRSYRSSDVDMPSSPSRVSIADTSPDSRTVVTYFGYAGLVLGPFFLLHFLGDVSEYFFRHLGFVVVFVTVIGAIGIYNLKEIIPQEWHATARPLAVGVLAIALVIALIAVFPSPYILLPSSHVTDYEVNGYQTAFEHHDDSVTWNGIRTGPGRQFDALTFGERPAVADGHSTYSEAELRSALADPTENQYLGVAERDVQREVIAYREFRYTQSAFELLETEPGVHHVQDNGEFDLYYVTGPSSPTAADLSEGTSESITIHRGDDNGPIGLSVHEDGVAKFASVEASPETIGATDAI